MHGSNIIGTKHAKQINAIVEEIQRKEANTSINLTKVHRSKCTGSRGLRVGVIIPHYLECNLKYG